MYMCIYIYNMHIIYIKKAISYKSNFTLTNKNNFVLYITVRKFDNTAGLSQKT